MCMICLLATNHSSCSVNPGTLDVSRSSHVGIKGASGHGNSGETFNAHSADVEMSDTRDCGAIMTYIFSEVHQFQITPLQLPKK